MGKKGREDAEKRSAMADDAADRPRLSRKDYEHELGRLQIELVKLQEWIKAKKLKVVVLFEGRDAAGKGGTIKRITECLNPRVCRVVALGTPTEREGDVPAAVESVTVAAGHVHPTTRSAASGP
jgi:polyphosphate kinase 2 (PPK2 family)